MARDVLELRRHAATVPDDLADPARFAQIVETAKDAFVLELRGYFRQAGFTTERRQEAPTVEKYAIGFGAGLDPYETFLQIVQEFPDILERMPHVAVTAAAGGNNRLTVGPPFIAHTQAPPRVVTALEGPYALAAASAQTNDISVNALPPGDYVVTIDGQPFTTTVAAGTAATVLQAIATTLRDAVGLLFEITLLPSPIIASTLHIRGREIGLAFGISVSANLGVVLVAAASVGAEPDRIVYRTTPDRKNPTTSTVVFEPRRFSSTTPVTAALAADVARVWNEQALYTEAKVVPVGVGDGVQFQTGGNKGGHTPNEIEILSDSTRNAVTVLGLGNFGNAAGGDTIGGVAPNMTLNVVGAGFTAAMIGRYVTLTGSGNDGRWLVSAVGGPGQLTFYNEDGVAEAIGAAVEWFIGIRDDSKNIARPVQNRYHMSAKLTVTIDILCEAPNTRREVSDLVWAFFTFFLEQKFFTIYGRGIFDEAYPDEHYQISIAQEVAASGEAAFARGDDVKNQVHTQRITVPVTITHYIDRQVLVPYGPSTGASWTLEAENVSADDTLPTPS